MSNLTTADLVTLSALVDFHRGPGYVLNFSDREFSQFFGREINVNIDDPKFLDAGTSKGKRLRTFLEKTDDATARKTLESLWAVRVSLIADTAQGDPVANALQRYQGLIKRLGGASSAQASQRQPEILIYDSLKAKLIELEKMAPHPRGYAFQDFLYRLFEANGTDPNASFRNRGEEIDGSFISKSNTYLLEAKWEAKQTGVAALRAFEGKITEKAAWARGLFISYAGFSKDGLVAFGRGKRTICLDGLDLYELLDRKLSLDQVIAAKERKAAETGNPFTNLRDLL